MSDFAVTTATAPQRWPMMLVTATALYFIYGLCLVIYRLYFSPIAHFPGPKLTAATGWYETWLDVFCGGQFTFQVEKWHRKYGPIIRITPWEIHIADAEFHEILYSQDSRYIKIDEFKDRLGIANSTFETIHHEHHRVRRGAISLFFSRQSILKYSDYIQEQVQRICSRLQNEYAGTGKVLEINHLWATLTADVITQYAFGTSYSFVDYEDFKAPYTTAIRHQARNAHLMGHFPWVLKVIKALPHSLVGILSPSMKPVLEFHNEATNHIKRIMHEGNQSHESVKHRTVFHEVLQSNLPPEEKTLDRLTAEASSVTGAGIDTTKSALSLATFHVLNNPKIYKRLAEELAEAIPNPNQMPSLIKLEGLPYLSAVINESLRLSLGIAQRQSRISLDTPIKYGDYVIPPGTRFGMSAYFTHRDPLIFPSPEAFMPERWLDNPKSPSGRQLSRYIVTFGKGPRICLGINLAQAEIVIGLATLFRRVKLSLYETTMRDVEMAAEYMIPLPVLDSRGIRVIVN